MSKPPATAARWRVPLRLLSVGVSWMKILLTAVVCGILPPPKIEDPPTKNPIAVVEKQRR